MACNEARSTDQKARADLDFRCSATASQHELIIDYVSHHAFSQTARVLTARPSRSAVGDPPQRQPSASASTPRVEERGDAMDVDEKVSTEEHEHSRRNSAFSASEISAMKGRKEIYDAILGGKISHALAMIQAQFPWILDTSRDRDWTPMDDEENGEDGDPAVDALATDIGYSNGFGKMSRSSTHTPREGSRSHPNGGSTPVTVNGLGVSTGIGSGPGSSGNSGFGGVNVSVNANSAASKSASSLPTVATIDRESRNGLSVEDSSSEVPAFPYAHILYRPTFLVLNLEIQAFVEGLREVAHSIPSSPPTTAGSSLASSMHSDMGGAGVGPAQGGNGLASASTSLERDASLARTGGRGPPSVSSATATTHARDTRSILSCLEAAGGLHARAKALPPKQAKVYGAEVEKVTALLAYTDMEASPLRGYLHADRRQQLADMVNGALLGESGIRSARQLAEVNARPVLPISSRRPASPSCPRDGHPSHDENAASRCGQCARDCASMDCSGWS